jgi:hypothetical protein
MVGCYGICIKAHGKGGTMENSMIFNILAKKENDMWVAHCLELDIVTTAKSLSTLKKEIVDLIVTQVDYAFSNDNLNNLYHPASPDVWKAFYACKEQEEKKIKLKSAFRTTKNLQTFVPPWIIAKTCTLQDSVNV